MFAGNMADRDEINVQLPRALVGGLRKAPVEDLLKRIAHDYEQLELENKRLWATLEQFGDVEQLGRGADVSPPRARDRDGTVPDRTAPGGTTPDATAARGGRAVPPELEAAPADSQPAPEPQAGFESHMVVGPQAAAGLQAASEAWPAPAELDASSQETVQDEAVPEGTPPREAVSRESVSEVGNELVASDRVPLPCGGLV